MMMMGTKRAARPAPARHTMRRTTSMTEFAPPDALADVAEEEADEETELQVQEEEVEEIAYGWIGGGAAAEGRSDWLAAYRARTAPALMGHRRNSADFSAVETAAFLRACGLCNRRLGPGRDTFMYKGEAAFCSMECREQHITHEEWKEKSALTTTTTKTPMTDPVAPASAGSDMAAAGGTLAAA